MQYPVNQPGVMLSEIRSEFQVYVYLIALKIMTIIQNHKTVYILANSDSPFNKN